MIHALISLYYPAESVLRNVGAIASQVDTVHICDNTPVSNRALFEQGDLPDNIRYTCFHSNLGLSGAFNRILTDPEYPWNDGDYVFFFDQDSLIGDDHVTRMVSIFESISHQGYRVGCLGPVYYNTSSGIVEIPRAKRTILDHTYAVSSIITSSMLSTYGNLRSIGFWNERVFLDMADWDLCWRLVRAGMLCCMTADVVLHHSVGTGVKKIGPLKLRVGQPFREYYQIRECLYLLGRSYTPLKYRIRFLAMLLVRSPLHLMFLDQKRLRLRYITEGFLDFWRGKSGALDAPWAEQN